MTIREVCFKRSKTKGIHFKLNKNDKCCGDDGTHTTANNRVIPQNSKYSKVENRIVCIWMQRTRIGLYTFVFGGRTQENFITSSPAAKCFAFDQSKIASKHISQTKRLRRIICFVLFCTLKVLQENEYSFLFIVQTIQYQITPTMYDH